MVTVMAIAGSGLLLLIVLIAIICHAFKKGQCCFSRKYDSGKHKHNTGSMTYIIRDYA